MSARPAPPVSPPATAPRRPVSPPALAVVAAVLSWPHAALAGDAVQGEVGVEAFSLHYQATVATQAHPGFHARYSGANSLRPGAESATSVVTDLFVGARLWSGAGAFLQPELAGGRGLSSTLGVAAFPSGEVYRVGDPAPELVVGRLFLRQVIGLGGGRVRVEPGPNQLAGAQDRDALTVTAGKLATTDVFDGNPVSNDPHTGFTSWGLWASAAYDYPADTRGYTYGVAADLSVRWWSLRAGAFLEPKEANGMRLDWDVSRSRGIAFEAEARYAPGGLPGAVRALVFHNTAPMGSYRLALAAAPPEPPDVTATRAPGRTKTGFAASADQDLGAGLSAFLRLSWNDGRTESWAFTEIDRSVAGGVVQSGARWGRPRDAAGVGLVVSGLSNVHRRYLAAGGLGFILGDGALRYGFEVLGEAFYRFALSREISLAVAYQPIFNPGYDRDRGPVSVFTGRVHVAL